MRPLERLWGPLGASLTARGASWGALGRVLGVLEEYFFLFVGLFFLSFSLILELLERSRASRDLRGPLFSKIGAPPRREHDFRNLYYQGTGSETMRERLFARK